MVQRYGFMQAIYLAGCCLSLGIRVSYTVPFTVNAAQLKLDRYLGPLKVLAYSDHREPEPA